MRTRSQGKVRETSLELPTKRRHSTRDDGKTEATGPEQSNTRRVDTDARKVHKRYADFLVPDHLLDLHPLQN